MATRPRGAPESKTSAFQVLSAQAGTGFPFAGRLVDNVSVGSFSPVLNRTITNANTDTIIPHELGRKPSGFLVIRLHQPAVVYDGSAYGSDWTATTITLRSSVANTTFSLLVF